MYSHIENTLSSRRKGQNSQASDSNGSSSSSSSSAYSSKSKSIIDNMKRFSYNTPNPFENKENRSSSNSSDANSSSSNKYLDALPPDLYPETLSSFADGIKGDVFELFSSFHKTFKVLMPFTVPSDNVDDILQDIEVTTTPLNCNAASAGSSKYKSNNNPKKSSSTATAYASSPKPTLTEEEQYARKNQYTGALRMRSKNMWTDKESNIDYTKFIAPTISKPVTSVKEETAKSITDSNSNSDGSNKPAKAAAVLDNKQPKVKEGGKVQLSKLVNNPSIQGYECSNNCMLIIGNKRMIYVQKNLHDVTDTVASVKWWQSFSEIESAVICYIGNGSKLDFIIRGGKELSVMLPDAITSTKILQYIQQKSSASSSSKPNSSSTVAGVTSDNAVNSSNKGNITPITWCNNHKIQHPTDTPVLEQDATAGTKRKVQPSDENRTPKKDRLIGRQDTSPPSNADSNVIVLTPKSCKIVDTCMRQIKSGVNELGVCEKLQNDGMTASEANKMLADAQRVINGAKLAIVVDQNYSTTPLKTNTSRSPAASATKRLLRSASKAIEKAGTSLLKSISPKRKRVCDDAIDSASTSTSEAVIPEAVRKYSLMLKNGVPMQAVCNKMKAEGVSQADQDIVLGNSTKPATVAVIPTVKAPIVAASKLMNLHWEPMAISKEIGRESIWGTAGDVGGVAGLSVGDEDLGHLAKLFGRKEAVTAPAATEAASESTGNDRKKRKVAGPKVIETSRSTNISICLASFRSKSMNGDDIINAIVSLNIAKLSVEDCQRVLEMAPTDTETKSLIAYEKTAKDAIDDLIEAEQLLLKMSKISNIKSLINVIIFIGTYKETTMLLHNNLNVLREAAGRVLLSEGLKIIMKSVLNIGNALNQGTWKGGATAFRIGSLTKLSQTKSSDGKCTLLDYLIELLHSKNNDDGEAASAIALRLDEELHSVICAKVLNLNEFSKDTRNIRRDLTNAAEIIKNISTSSSSSASVTELETIMQQAEIQVSNLEVTLQAASKKCEEMSCFVGEEVSSSSIVIGVLCDFLMEFKAAKSKYSKRIEMELKKAKAKK